MTKMTKTENDILKEAKANYQIAVSAWSEFNKEAKETLKFIAGDQWDTQLKRNRTDAGLPALTANSLPTFLRHITNEARQNTPAIQIDPADNDSSVETAEVIADLIRGIEQESGADTAYDTASWYAAATGLGFIRVLSDYVDPGSFSQKLIIKAVNDPETVLMDPSHKSLNGSDAKWCFVISTMTCDEYQRQFAGTKLNSKIEEKSWSSNQSQWIREDEVVIAEYYWIDYEPATLYQVFDATTGQTITTTTKPDQNVLEAGLVEILKTRPTEVPIIRWAKMNDAEILEETSWPGDHIPVIAIKGDESWVNGKRKLKGAVADAMDSQRVLNYFFSVQAELVSLAPKAPFIGEIRQFANFEHLWRDSNVAPSAYLPYNAVDVGGSVLPPPQRSNNAPDIQAAMAMCQQARENLKSIFGIYDASLGATGNETSGRAILARTKQSHTSTYHFYDNLVKGIQQVGTVLVETIPAFYNDERIVQLVKRNGSASTRTINGPDSEHNLALGKYGVVVETGPSYATRRQDSVDHMIALGQSYPQAMPLISDIIASESDWPGAKQVANRLRMALPIEIQQAEAESGNSTPGQQAQLAQSQLKQVSEQLKALNAHAQVTEEKLKFADEENKLLKLKSGVELEKAGMDRDIKLQQMQLDEMTTALEFKVKERELDMQERALKVQEAKLAIEGIEAAHDMAKDLHTRETDHIKNNSSGSMKVKFDAIDVGENGAGIGESPAGLSHEL